MCVVTPWYTARTRVQHKQLVWAKPEGGTGVEDMPQFQPSLQGLQFRGEIVHHSC